MDNSVEQYRVRKIYIFKIQPGPVAKKLHDIMCEGSIVNQNLHIYKQQCLFTT